MAASWQPTWHTLERKDKYPRTAVWGSKSFMGSKVQTEVRKLVVIALIVFNLHICKVGASRERTIVFYQRIVGEKRSLKTAIKGRGKPRASCLFNLFYFLFLVLVCCFGKFTCALYEGSLSTIRPHLCRQTDCEFS